VAKKPSKPEHKDFRIVIMAEPSWVDQVDAAAKAQGMERSQYMRWAVNNQMRRDIKESDE
jgi:hypothetical protein